LKISNSTFSSNSQMLSFLASLFNYHIALYEGSNSDIFSEENNKDQSVDQTLRNNKAKLLIEKSCKKHFCTKKTACRMLLKLTPAFRIPLIAFRTAVRPRAGRPTWSLPPTNKSISMMTNPKSISVFLIEKNITRLKTV